MAIAREAPRRERILSAAAAEFARHGFAGARVERIAATAGVNKQLLFHYFGSKAGLHRAALSSLLDHSITTIPASRAPVERLRELTASLSALIASHPSLLTLVASKAGNPDGAAMASDWLSRGKQAVRQILQDGQRAGYLRDDVEVDAVAEVIMGATLGMTTAGDPETAGRRDGYRDTLLRMTLDYCSWR